MPWLIDFQDEKVIIIGGGKVAFRKAEQFLKHQAQVIVIARDFIDDFQLLDCQQIQDQYSCHYLNEAFFVYSATDDKEINQQIVNDAKKDAYYVCKCYSKQCSIHEYVRNSN